MADYNVVEPSRKANDFVEGTEAADSIFSGGDNSTINALGGNDYVQVRGNHSTVNAGDGDDIISLRGGSNNGGIWIDGEESNGVYGGAGNDSVYVGSRGASIYGETGNDTVNLANSYVYVNGGEGNDVFDLQGNYKNVNNITITSGAGNDSFIIGAETPTIKAVITDFSNDDIFRFNRTTYSNAYSYYTNGGVTRSHGRTLTQHVENGNVVISDNVSISSSGGDNFTKNVEPNLSITLQGVSDISQVANAKYYLYHNTTPISQSTFGELFGVSSSVDTPTTTTTATEQTTTSITPTVESSASVTPIVINNYYGDYYDNSGNNGMIINQSSVSGGVTNTTNIDNSKNIVISGNTWTYSGGDKVINNYQQGEVVKLASDYQGIGLNGNSFYVNSSSGSLEIQNARDKFIGYSAESEVAVYSYVASGGGNVDGRDKSQIELMIGGDNADNQIYAGNGGSSMWGGNGGNDVLTGGEGYDEFFYAVGSGNDVVQNAASNDVINLLGVSLEQIVGLDVNLGQVNVNFADGGNLKVEGNSGVGYKLGDVVYTVNQSTGQWSTK